MAWVLVVSLVVGTLLGVRLLIVWWRGFVAAQPTTPVIYDESLLAWQCGRCQAPNPKAAGMCLRCGWAQHPLG